MSELRYHPFLDEWVITATHRQDRTFLPPADYNPLAPTKPGGFPTEIPFSSYDLVVFENKFPSLQLPAIEPLIPGSPLCPVRKSEGVCEVICYTERADSTFATLDFNQIRKLTRVWQARYVALCQIPEVEYVFIFENKGKEIGVTLNHPHGQIYAYPFIPPIPARELQQEKAYFDAHGEPMMAQLLRDVETSGLVVWQNELFSAFIPPFARYPYEVYVVPRRHIASLAEMDYRDLDGLAEAMLVVARKYDALFGFSMPYIMAMHQKPAMDGYEYAWFHAEFYPPYRTETKLKYLAGSEAGAGAFINDTVPEVTAPRMRALSIPAIV